MKIEMTTKNRKSPQPSLQYDIEAAIVIRKKKKDYISRVRIYCVCTYTKYFFFALHLSCVSRVRIYLSMYVMHRTKEN